MRILAEFIDERPDIFAPVFFLVENSKRIVNENRAQQEIKLKKIKECRKRYEERTRK